MAEQMRFGIIGCGVIGPTHARALSQIPDARLVAVCDVVPEKAERLAATYQAKPYTDPREMLEREQLDIVDVCTPSGMHGDHACLVMQSGRHVIVEKPMEITREAVERMLRTQQETGVKMAVISQHRFDSSSQRVHAMAQEQAFGTLVLGSAEIPWWRSQQYYDSGAWRGTWELDGGGVLMNQGIHAIDILQWLMGPVQSVYGHTATRVHRMDTEDVGVAVLRFANGALGTIAGTTGAYPGAGTRIQVFGDHGAAIIEDDHLTYLQTRKEGEEVSPYGASAAERAAARAQMAGGSTSDGPQEAAAIGISSHIAQITDMMQAVREGRQPLVTGEEARRPVDIILGIYESDRTKKEVVLP